MERPQPSDFGIREEAIPWAESLEQEIRKESAWIAIVFAPLGLIIRESLWSVILGWFAAWMVLWGLLALRLWLVNSAYRSVKRYKKALAAFEAWWVRTQETFWMSLGGLQFERELAALYNRMGMRATLTPPSGDGGVDIWLDLPEGKKIVQCKAHRAPIGPAAARELHGTLIHLGAKGAVLASTSGFTRGAREYSMGKPIELLGLRGIIEMQKSAER